VNITKKNSTDLSLSKAPGSPSTLDIFPIIFYCASPEVRRSAIFFVSPQMETSLEVTNMTRVQQFVLLGLSTRLEVRDALFSLPHALPADPLVEHARRLPHLHSQ
jgi:hypothetical protein